MEIDDYIPIRECEHKIEDDVVTVLFKNFEKTWLDKLIKPKKEKVAKIELDQIGSFVWLQCDGKKRVKEIVTLTKKQFEDDDQIEERVKLFLTQLESKKFIRFYTLK